MGDEQVTRGSGRAAGSRVCPELNEGRPVRKGGMGPVLQGLETQYRKRCCQLPMCAAQPQEDVASLQRVL